MLKKVSNIDSIDDRISIEHQNAIHTDTKCFTSPNICMLCLYQLPEQTKADTKVEMPKNIELLACQRKLKNLENQKAL